MAAIKHLPTHLLRHIAKHPNSTLDSTFVNPKPVDSWAKLQAEHDLLEAIYYLWETGNIAPKPTDSPQYQGTITYQGLNTLEASKRSFLEIIAAVWTIVAAIVVLLAAVMTIAQGIFYFMYL